MPKVIISNITIECFANQRELDFYMIENKSDKGLIYNTLYFGELYGIPTDVREEFGQIDIMYNIKKQNYNDVQFILIHK